MSEWIDCASSCGSMFSGCFIWTGQGWRGRQHAGWSLVTKDAFHRPRGPRATVVSLSQTNRTQEWALSISSAQQQFSRWLLQCHFLQSSLQTRTWSSVDRRRIGKSPEPATICFACHQNRKLTHFTKFGQGQWSIHITFPKLDNKYTHRTLIAPVVQILAFGQSALSPAIVTSNSRSNSVP